jgi:hypothetical protein
MTHVKSYLILISYLLIAFLLIGSFSVNSINNLNEKNQSTYQQESLWIDADSDLGSITLRNGFIHGRDESQAYYNESMIAALEPEEWRLFKFRSYELAQNFAVSITYEPYEHYVWAQGGYPYANPWEDWDEYEAYVLYDLQSVDYYFPDFPPEYYDIWNEPDLSYFWHGTYNQLLELFYRTYTVIKEYKPDAKVVGPSISWFKLGYSGVAGIIDFLVDLDTIYGIRLDAISWHENGGTSDSFKPDGIPTRAQYLRSQIQEHFPPEYNPEFHVNEFMGKQVHLSPGWNVGFLYYLEKAHIDRAMRSCWWVYSYAPYESWCDCWEGLNGMLMNDGETPQPAYWVWQTFAQMKKEIKLDGASSDVHTNVIATRNASTNIITLLFGRYLKTSSNTVGVTIQDYHYSPGNIRIKTEIIYNSPDFYTDPPRALPMPNGPEWVSDEIVEVIDQTIQIMLNDYADGDAYIVTIYPPPQVPEISGTVNGKPKIEYEYTFVSENPSRNDLFYYIDWGDGTVDEWIGSYCSGEEIIVNHSWGEKGSFTVKAKVKDTKGLESDWGTLEVTMPKGTLYIPSQFFELLERLMERFPHTFPTLRQLLGN